MAQQYTSLPQFVNADAQQILDDMVTYYQNLTGKTLQPAQVEKLLIQTFAYREKLLRDNINDMGRMQLLDFSRAPMLDYLVALVGVTRLPAQKATVLMDFAIITGHTGVTIPAGTRIQSSDGKAVFQTISSVFIPTGTYAANGITCACQVAGTVGNGYLPGTINNILDPQPFLVSAENATTSGAGADKETDAQLIARAKLANNAFSTAGSKAAYKFWALSSHPSIVDCGVLGPNDDPSIPPGEVHLYPLVDGGIATSAPILAAVLATCSDDVVRPLTDTVVVQSPTPYNYNIVVDIIAFNGAIDADIIATATAALNDYAQEARRKVGQDIVYEKHVALSMVPGVYSAIPSSPAATIALTSTQFANAGTITVNIVGHTNG